MSRQVPAGFTKMGVQFNALSAQNLLIFYSSGPVTFLITYVCAQKFYKEDPLPKSVCSETPKYVDNSPINTRDVRPNTCLKKLDFEIIIQSMFRRRKLLLGNMQISFGVQVELSSSDQF